MEDTLINKYFLYLFIAFTFTNLSADNSILCENKGGLECFELGEKYMMGKGVKEDIPKSIQLFKKSCDKGYVDGCLVTGSIFDKGRLGVMQDSERAITFFKQACNLNSGDGCYSVGHMYFEGNKKNVSLKEALSYLKKSCSLGYSNGCIAYKNTTKNLIEKISFFRDYCFDKKEMCEYYEVSKNLAKQID
jgi:TPR repeat protein